MLDFRFQDAARDFAAGRRRPTSCATSSPTTTGTPTPTPTPTSCRPSSATTTWAGSAYFLSRQRRRRRRRAAAARPARARADVPLPRQAGRLLRRRAGLHRRRRRPGRPPGHVRQPGRRLPRRRPARHRRAPTRSDNFDTDAPALPAHRATSPRCAQAHPALRDGAQITPLRRRRAGVYAFSRIDRGEQRRVRRRAQQRRPRRRRSPSTPDGRRARSSGIYGGSGGEPAGADGEVTVTVPAPVRRSCSGPARPTRRRRRSRHHRHSPARARRRHAGGGHRRRRRRPLATVTFAAQVGDGKWTLLGTADHAPVHGSPRPDRPGRRHAGELQGGASATAAGRPPPRPAPPTVAATPAQAAARDYAVVHYKRADGDYDDWRLYAWGDIDRRVHRPGRRASRSSAEDAYGAFAWVKLKPGASSSASCDRQGRQQGRRRRPHDRRHEDRRDLGRAGRRAIYPSRQAAAGEPDPPARTHAPSSTTTAPTATTTAGACTCGTAPPTRPTGPARCSRPAIDAYGASSRCRSPTAPPALSYIIHKGDEKDLPDDQSLDLATYGHEVWLLAGQRGLPAAAAATGAGADTDLTKPKAHWIDRDHRRVEDRADRRQAVRAGHRARPAGSPSPTGELTGDVTTLPLRAQRNGLTEAQRRSSRTCRRTRAFTVDRARPGQGPAALRGQLVVTERDAEGALLAATGVQIPGVLDDVYAGATERASARPSPGRRRPSRVWAPTAQTVALELFDSPDGRAEDGADEPRRPHRRLVGHRRPRPGRASYYRYEVQVVAARRRSRSSPRRSPTRTPWRWPPTPRTASSSTWPTRRSRPPAGPRCASRPRAGREGADPGAARPRLLGRRHHGAGRAAGHLPRVHRPGTGRA